MQLNQELEAQLLRHTKAEHVTSVELLQSLWGGYGELFRATLAGAPHPSVVVKHIQFAQPDTHPRGWNTDRSYQRKRHSYQVEQHWYTHYSARCPAQAKVPACLHSEANTEGMLILLEDLGPAGFPLLIKQMEQVHWQHIAACLDWLAHLHARFLSQSPDGLWRHGGYWHLDTRPDELAALDDPQLKQAAPLLDQILHDSPFQTLIHGDAKIANFCFSADAARAAAVDFQYVGQGCGMQDVMLLISSCVPPELCAKVQQDVLDHYFAALEQALSLYQPNISRSDIESAWRPLYAVAWADFQRFVKGWCPDHWKINDYSNSMTEAALQQLDELATAK